MTEREFLTGLNKETMNDAQKEYVTERIAKLDERNVKRKNTPTKTQKENEGVMNTIVATLTEKGKMLASEIATAVGISTQKVSGLCKLLVDANRIKVEDVKVKNKGTLKQYSVVETTDEVADEVADEE